MLSEGFKFICIYSHKNIMEKKLFFFFGQYKRNYTNRKTPQVTGALIVSDRDCQQDEGGRGAQAGLGQGWQRGCLLFGLPAVAGFAELPLQNHLPGDAGHLTVGHCVGSVPAEERNCSDPKSRAHTCTTLAPVATLTFGDRIHFAGRAGSVWQRKTRSTSDQNLASEVLRRPALARSRKEKKRIKI